MSAYMKDSGHRWMRDCDDCAGWFHCAAPDDSNAVDAWTCGRCLNVRAALAKAEQERDAAREEMRAYVHVAIEAAQILAGEDGPLGEGVVNGARRVAGERDAAVADNAEVLAALKSMCHTIREQGGFVGPMLDLFIAQPHPGATLLEQHRKELVRLSAALADVQRKVEHWGHGGDCAATDGWDDEVDDARKCDCGKGEILAVLSPADGSLPGAAFLSRRDALAKEVKEAKRGLVRARNEGIEKAVQAAGDAAAAFDDKSGGSDAKTGPRIVAVTQAIRALKEPEE